MSLRGLQKGCKSHLGVQVPTWFSQELTATRKKDLHLAEKYFLKTQTTTTAVHPSFVSYESKLQQ